MEIQTAVKANAELGEGPIWNADKQCLYWIDILANKLHIYEPETQQNRTIDVGQPIGTVVPRTSGGVIVALRDGIACLDLFSEELTFLSEIEREITDNRFNDGKCDPAGRFWAGTMNFDSTTISGTLYCMDADLTVTPKVSSVTISNGLAWSPDHKKMYYIDTPTRKVVAYDYDINNGHIQNPTTVIENDSEGHMDGMAIDEKGMLWIALWGGSAVKRFNPQNGELLETIELRVTQVTACAFGGKDLDELYITTAATGLDGEALSQQPLAGSLFRVKTSVKGLPSYAFRG
jgi:sugar lactone lactonase YvrE